MHNAPDDDIGILLKGISKVVSKIVIRAIEDDPDSFKDELNPEFQYDPTVEALDHLSQSFLTGAPVDRKKIDHVVFNQEDRAQLMDSLSTAHEYARLVRFLKTRSKLESVLHRACEIGKLTPSETLVFLQYITSELSTINKRIKSGGTNIKDIESILGKIDYAMNVADENKLAQYADTNPQAREMIRRIGHKIQKSVKD